MPTCAFRLLFGSLVAFGGGGLVAQTTSPDNGGMTEARREFQELKATEAVPDSTRLDLPKVGGPDLPTATPAAPVPITQRQREELLKARRKALKEKNWLVNGVLSLEKQGDGTATSAEAPDAANPNSDDERALDPFEQLLDPKDPTLADRKGDDRKADGRADRDETPQDPAAAKAPNPLSAFMADWMSSRDRQLLAPATGEGTLTASALLGPDAGAPGDSPTGFRGPDGPPRGGAGPAPGISALSDNPYLADLAPVAEIPAAPAMLAPLPAPVTVTAPPSVAVRNDPPPAVAPRKSDLPAPLAKPDEDEKYFPQLKRF